jgi:hypothetical protein
MLEKVHFLFPSHPLKPPVIDEMFSEQRTSLGGKGFSTSLCHDSAVQKGRPLRDIPAGSTVIYRGWMHTAEEYGRLVNAVTNASATMLTSPASYIAAHHLPNWYPLIAPLTPETRVFPRTADLESELRALNWDAFFIKDYVKSLKTSRGAIIHDPAEIHAVAAEMEQFRGQIEGGFCVRRVESFIADSEKRYFVLDGKPFAAGGGQVPEIVNQVVRLLPLRFFSVDVVSRSDGVLRIVEIGDGQVSDLVGWSAEEFAAMWVAAIRH